MTLGFWMDGKLLATQIVETKPSGLVYFNPYSEEEFRLFLPEGDHVFRAGFIDDEFVKTLPQSEAYNRKKNKFLDSIMFVGPFASTTEKASRKKILICDPSSGRACVEKIVTDLARRAYRRPVTRAEIDSLMRFVDLAKAEGQSAEQGMQLAIQAMLVSPHFPVPHRARSRPARSRARCTRCRRSSSLRASATSCGARCPTTSCWRSPRPASCATRACSRRK